MTAGVGTAVRGTANHTTPPAHMTPAANHAAARSEGLEKDARTAGAVGGRGESPLGSSAAPVLTASVTGACIRDAVNRYPRLAIVSMYWPLSAVSPSALRSANTW